MRYRIFGNTGLRVSSLALGTGNFGKGWGYGADQADAHAIYRHYREAGGNFIDTADQYQFGQSEAMLGEFIASERDDIILASKYSLGDSPTAGLHASGNSRKAFAHRPYRPAVGAHARRRHPDRRNRPQPG
jgi:aryl-alcohol dehydrogenase-like predicted oxidoreductase